MFRLADGVPLIIPEVNGGGINSSGKLIAGPNCTITGAAVALAGVHRRFRVSEQRLATYQAVSGAGKGAMRQLEDELRGYFRTGSVPALKDRRLPGPIAFNLFPQVGGFDAAGNSSEENKVAVELRKIWGDGKIRISCTAVRVPVLRGHSLAVWFKTARSCSAAALKKELLRTPGLKFFARAGDYPTPLRNGTRSGLVYAGRLRSGTVAGEYQLWIVSDNLYKGAALNSVQIAERIARL
jgi:aspartate-semialdehyde dehydrogenase